MLICLWCARSVRNYTVRTVLKNAYNSNHNARTAVNKLNRSRIWRVVTDSWMSWWSSLIRLLIRKFKSKSVRSIKCKLIIIVKIVRCLFVASVRCLEIIKGIGWRDWRLFTKLGMICWGTCSRNLRLSLRKNKWDWKILRINWHNWKNWSRRIWNNYKISPNNTV